MSAGTSIREAARRLHNSPRMDSKTHAIIKEIMPVNKGGRPKEIQARPVDCLELKMKRSMIRTATEATTVANEFLPETVSLTTFRRRLRSLD
ncbi:hypothetical protein BG015_005535 [Linnemannia schmuckeri]|uniref:Transposase n=1 Tax=Linnemannia schmuckeri TaxID=64567 RepID=A0A9P5R465_9FUNG|nr:hypothetical protein BG015_005535 [Linnemannia schmuckeri]